MEDPKLPPTEIIGDPTSLDAPGAQVIQPGAGYGSAVQYPVDDLEVHELGSKKVVSSAQAPQPKFVQLSRRRALIVSSIITLIVVLLTGLSAALFLRDEAVSPTNNLTGVEAQDISLEQALPNVGADELQGTEQALLVNGNVITRGELRIVQSGYTTIIRAEGNTANNTFLLPNSSGTLCLNTNNCDYATSADLQSLQQEFESQLGQIALPADDVDVSALNNQSGAVSIQGTSNQISVSTSNGVVTLSTPQDLAAISSPTFANLLLTNNFTVNGVIDTNLNCTGFANNGSLTTNASGQIICADDDGGASGVSTPGGTAGTLAVFTAGQTIADSIISQALGTATVTGNLSVTGSLSANTLSLVTALGVANGGTGATTLTSNGVLLGGGAGAITATSAPGAGQVLLGNAGVPTFTSLSGDVTVSSAGVTAVQADSIALTTDTTGNYVANLVAGNGISVGVAGEGATPTVALSVLSSDWDQTGAFDIVLNNAASELRVLESVGATFFGTLDVGDLSANRTYTLPDSTGTVCLDSGNCLGGTGGASNAANYLTIGNDATLTGERSIAAGTNLSAVDGGANAAYTLNVVNNPTFSGLVTASAGLDLGTQTLQGTTAAINLNNFDVDSSGNITNSGTYNGQTLGASSSFTGSLTVATDLLVNGNTTLGNAVTDTITITGILQGGSPLVFEGATSNAHQITVAVADPSADRTYTIPFVASDADFCLSTGNCAGVGGGVTTVAGTTNRVAKFTSAQAIADSTITDDGTNVSISGNFALQGGLLTIGAAAQAGSIVLNDGDGETITLNMQDVGANYALTLPAGVGNANQCLKAQNGTGTLFWDDCLGGGGSSGITSVDGQSGPSVNINNATGSSNVITIDDAVANGSTKGIASFNSTNFSSSSGVINTIQNIDTTATPSFAGLGLSGNLNINANTIQGTTAIIDFSNFDVASNGSVTGGTYNGQTISSSANFTGSLDVAGLTTLTGGLTVQNGDTLTFNSDAITDLTGNGLQVSGGTLTLLAQANKGLEVDSNGISLIDCASGEILKYNGSNQWVCDTDAGGSGLGDNVSVNGTGATDANFVNTTATGTVAGVTWLLDSVPNPDEVSLTIGAASGTEAGVVTTGNQTLAGDKTFTGLITLNGNVALQNGDTITINGDAFNDLTGTGLQFNSGSLETTLGTSIDLAAEVTGTLGVTNGGTGATTLTANGILYGNTTGAIQATAAAANSILATNGSNIPSLTQTLPTAVQGNITSLGTITSGVWNGTALTDTYLADTLTVDASSTVAWAALSSYPAACSAGEAITQLGDSVTCSVFAAGSGSGNYIQNQNSGQQSSSNFWISGSGRADTSLLTPTIDTATAGTLTVGGTNATAITLADDTTISAGKYLRITGDNTAGRPATPSAGMLFYDTTTNQLLQYNGTKWVSDRTEAVIVAASNSSQAEKDGADYVADGNGGGAGDGDQVEINAALTAASGKKVVLLAGTYVADATILIPNNTALVGIGNGSLIELADLDASDNLIENSDTTTGTGISVSDLKLDGRSDLNTAGTQYGIYLNNMGGGTGASARPGAKVNNINLTRFRSGNLYLDASSNGQYSSIHTLASGGPGVTLAGSSNHNTLSTIEAQGNTGSGISLSTSSYTSLANIVAQGNTADGVTITSSDYVALSGSSMRQNSGNGITVSSSDYASVSGNTLYSNGGDGINASTGTGNTYTGNNTYNNTGDGFDIANTLSSVTGNTSVSNVNGFVLSNNNLTVTGNVSRSNSSYGMYLNNSNNSTLTGNNVSSNATYGIYLNGSDDNSVSDNRIADNGGASNNNGIYIASSDTNTISDNTITDSSAATDYAINISSTGTPTGNRLSGNSLGAGSIFDGGTATIYGGQVNGSGNYVVDPTGTVELQSTTNITGDLNGSANADFNGSLTVGNSNQFNISNTGVVTSGTWNGSAIGISYGGTGATTSQAAINTLSQLTTDGDLLYFNGTNSTRLARGANGECLTANATTVVWGSCGAGSGANQQLSNLSGTVAVNMSLNPGTDNTLDLGSSGNSWRTLYADTSVLTPNVDVASAGALGIGNSTATSVSICNSANCDSITIGSNADADTITLGDSLDTVGINGTVTVTGATSVSGGAITLTGNTSSSFTTTTGTMLIQPASALTMKSGNNAGGSTAGVTIATGDAGAGTSGSISIDNGTSTSGTPVLTIGGSNARLIQLGNTTAASTTTINGGTGSGAISIYAGTSGSIWLGASNNNSVLIGNTGGTVSLAGPTTASAGLTVTNGGDIAFQRNTTDITTTGTLTDLNIGNGALFRFAGASAQTLSSIANPADGRIVTLINAAATALTIQNDTGGTAANRIITGTGANLNVPAGSTIQLTYDSSNSRWRVIGEAATSGGGANQQLSNLSGTVAVNASLTPNGDNTLDLGSSGNSWRTLYADTSVLTPTIDTATAGTLTVGGTNATAITLADDTTISAGKYLRITGDNTAGRPATPSAGMLFYDTTTNQLLQYNGTKWVSDRTEAVIVAASNSSQAEKDGADYVADGNGGGAGDGDQVEINAALTAASGKKVVLLAGTYVADATILVPNNTALVGVGNGSLIELADLDASDNLIENSDTTTGTGISVSDLRLDGRSDLNTAGTQHGIFLSGMGDDTPTYRRGATISNLSITRFRNTGIQLASLSANNTISGNVVSSSTYGINISSSPHNAINNNVLNQNGLGLGISSSNNNSVVGNTANDSSSIGGIYIDSSYSTTIDANTANSGTFNGLYINNSTDMTITGNTFNSNGANGIEASGSSNNTLSGNIASSNNGNGVNLTSSSDFNALTGNTFYSNGDYTINLNGSNSNNINGNKVSESNGVSFNNGIFLTSSDSNSITQNVITDSSALTDDYAIVISDAASDDNIIQGNTLGSGTISDSGTGTIYGGQLNGFGDFVVDPVGTITLQSNTSVTGTLAASGVSSLTGGAEIRGLTVDTATATDDRILTTVTAGGAARFNGTITNTDLTAARTWTLPNESGTFCMQGSVNCGFAAGTSASYIQNQNSSQQSSSNFWISGSGRADTSLLTPTVDTATAVALNIGITTATGVNLSRSGQSTTVNGSLSIAETTTAGGNITFAVGANRTLSVATQTSSNTAGNNLTLSSATGNGTGAGGDLVLQAGASGAGATGNGGSVNINAGSAGSTNGSGGSILLTPGSKTGSGSTGQVLIKPAASNDASNTFQIQNAAGTNILRVGTADQTVLPNLATNGSVEQDTTNWVARSGTTMSRTSTYANTGSYSVSAATNAVDEGLNYSMPNLANGTYIFTAYVRGTISSNVELGYSADGSTHTSCAASESYSTGGWRIVKCGSLTATSWNSSAFVYIRVNSATSQTIYIDGLQIASGTNVPSYSNGTLQVDGMITSRLNMMLAEDSESAFSIQTATGNGIFSVNTETPRVGIGLDQPNAMLHIARLASSDDLLRVTASGNTIFNVFDDASNTRVNVTSRLNDTQAFYVEDSGGDNILTVDTSNDRVSIDGTTQYTERLCHDNADGAAQEEMILGDCNAVGQADLAEMYDTNGNLEPGDVVYPAGQYKVDKTSQAYQNNAIGVVSTNPTADGIIGNNVTSATRQPIALAGRIPVKVSLENGPIAAGDYLTPSPTPGFAMKATAGGRVIGVALEDYDGSQSRVSALVAAEEADRNVVHATDLSHYVSNSANWPANTAKIMVFANATYFAPTDDSILQGSDMTLTGNAIINGNLKIGSNLNVSGDATLTKLTVTGNVSIGGTLEVTGDINTRNIIVNGHIITAGDVPEVFVGTGAGVGATVVSIEGNDTSGTITVEAGIGATADELARVAFTQAFGNKPRITLTPANRESAKLGLYYEAATTTQNELKIFANNQPEAGKTYSMTYFIVE